MPASSLLLMAFTVIVLTPTPPVTTAGSQVFPTTVRREIRNVPLREVVAGFRFRTVTRTWRTAVRRARSSVERLFTLSGIWKRRRSFTGKLRSVVGVVPQVVQTGP